MSAQISYLNNEIFNTWIIYDHHRIRFRLPLDVQYYLLNTIQQWLCYLGSNVKEKELCTSTARI